MRGKIQIGSAVFLLIAAVGTLGLVVYEYRRDSDVVNLMYTRSVKKHDIVDAAQRALSALTDAEIREQDYVLTGETVYSEAYADDIRTWEDEFASLELVARNDPATPLVQDLSKAGTSTLTELALVVSLYEKSGREAAIGRIKKSSGIVYLDQARNSVAKIQEVEGADADGARQILSRASSGLRRLAAGGVMLFVLVAVGTFLLILEIRRSR